MTGNYPSWESNMLANKTDHKKRTIEAQNIHYRQLNEQIRLLAHKGVRQIILNDVRGQRYLAAGLDFPDLLLQINGIPGEDMGFNLNGSTVEAFGHGQNAIANTMNSGKIIVHGLGGDALAYGMRGGQLFVRDDVGYRVGIHMKEYHDQVPLVVVGGTAGDYLGEYMAGGIIILLNRHNASEIVTGNSAKGLATGIHGGEIYIYAYDVPPYLLGIGAGITSVDKASKDKIKPYILEFCHHFALAPEPLLNRELLKITSTDSRPFAKFYYPAYPVNTGLKPEHLEQKPPCEVNCPAGISTGRFLYHLRQGELAEAVQLLDDVTPLRYSCCGFICPHLCMENCTREKVDFPVRTAELAKRFKSDLLLKPVEQQAEKIAVIGAGPAGLNAAYQLARKGYSVTIFDEGERPGGKLYQVISRTRLPLEALEHDLKRIEKLGVKFILSTRVNALLFTEISQQFDHVIVAVGAHRPILPPVKGVEHLQAGLDFLKEYNQQQMQQQQQQQESTQHLENKTMTRSKKAVVVGGGDSAIDGIEALIAKGFLPHDITVIDIKKPAAKQQEREKMQQKGVVFRYPLFLQEATSEGITVADATGNQEFIPATTILVFINERPLLDFLPSEVQESKNQAGFYESQKENSFQTSLPWLSIVGDACELGLVTTNIGSGRQCALEVDAILRGHEYLPEVKETKKEKETHPERALPLSEEETAKIDIEEEYDRCLHCGICIQCDSCVEACPRQALTREESEFTLDLTRCGGCGTCAATCLGGVIHMVQR